MFEYRGRRIELLSLISRAGNGELFWRNSLETIRLSDRHGCSGILILTGNEIAVEPWLIAQAVAAGSAHLQPLVAVNPVYMHPFTVARMISSFGLMFRRRVRLNLVTGTSLSHLAALGDGANHDERYDRLLEYASIVDGLLQGMPLTVDGRYYTVDGLQLLPALDEALRPHYYVAGHSDAAARVASRIDAIGLQMLGPALADGAITGQAIHFGIVTREDEASAWVAARARFPDDELGRFVQQQSMNNTDSQWKRRLQLAAAQETDASPEFWMLPFKTFQADCPFFVGGHERTAELLASLIRAGVHTFVLDIPLDECEYANTAAAFARAARLLDG
ncbi:MULTISPECIES: LLM class flavin-dependent oxidoreductase [Xanthomonas]|uniref:LLM class flavin-dependent oxidoreductase n=2 Tax=Xanthomonas TaxID=338 RepID=A0A9X4BSU0_9XANT|nr:MULTISPECIES: LLM class flavin-dependent oxidoreductase [Xanthomonas]MDC8638894.1 LLM class flavin-dependent oxidoreductase [Xanthomonas hortorum pv. hederae]